MHTTQQAAYDEIIGIARAGWLANGTSAPFTLLYDDVKEDKPGVDANGLPLTYARVSVADIDSERGCIAPIGERTFEETALCTVQIFTPPGDGRTLSNELLQIVRDFFRASTSSIIEIIQVGPPERIGQDGGYFVANMPALFRFYQEG